MLNFRIPRRFFLSLLISVTFLNIIPSVTSFQNHHRHNNNRQAIVAVDINNNNNINCRRRHLSSKVFTTLQSIPPRRAYDGGLPSSPGWKSGQLDALTEWAVSNDANRPVICEYESSTIWLWSKWRGTVLNLTYKVVLFNMLIAAIVAYTIPLLSSSESWSLLTVPPQDDPTIELLHGLNVIWEYQVTLVTFILTFFTAEAYKHWQNVYFTTRAIQGRINDICLLLTIVSCCFLP